MGRDPRRSRASQERPAAATAEIRQRLPKLSSQRHWTSWPLGPQPAPVGCDSSAPVSRTGTLSVLPGTEAQFLPDARA